MAVPGASGDFTVRIDGLTSFARALKIVNAQYPLALKEANYDLANAVVELAKERAATVPGVARKAAESLRAARQQSAAVVSGGGARSPYFFGAEFGSIRFHQFQSWRGNQWSGFDGGPGYFLHPTIRDHANELIDKYMDRLDLLQAEAFPL